MKTKPSIKVQKQAKEKFLKTCRRRFKEKHSIKKGVNSIFRTLSEAAFGFKEIPERVLRIKVKHDPEYKIFSIF